MIENHDVKRSAQTEHELLEQMVNHQAPIDHEAMAAFNLIDSLEVEMDSNEPAEETTAGVHYSNIPGKGVREVPYVNTIGDYAVMDFAVEVPEVQAKHKAKNPRKRLIATAKLGAARMRICKSCPYLQTMNRCQLCGCFMNAKTRMENAGCPINKW